VGNKLHHIPWRLKYKRLDQDSRDMRKEFLLSQALVYFLGSAMVAQASPPNRDYGFMTIIFKFVNDNRFILALIVLVLSLFLFYSALISKPKAVMPFALLSVQAGSFIPLIFFLMDLLRVVLELLKDNPNGLYALIFYFVGLSILTSAIIWNIVTFSRKYGHLNKQLAVEQNRNK
jgi:hypothetical protein